MSENPAVLPIENLPGKCSFCIQGERPHVDFDGAVYQGLNDPFKFSILIVPPDEQIALITDQSRIEIDFGQRYQPKNGVVMQDDVQVDLAAFAGAADWRIEKSKASPGVIAFQPLPGKSVRFCGKIPVKITILLPSITQDIFLATTYVHVSLKTLATNSIRAETRFPILSDLLSSDDVEFIVKSSHQTGESPTCLPSGLESYLDLEFKVSKKGYLEIPPRAQILQAGLEETFTPDELSALARCSDENFEVLALGSQGIRIVSASRQKIHITKGVPLRLRLGPVRASLCKETQVTAWIYNMGYDRQIRLRFLVCDVKVKFDEKEQLILWEGRASGGGQQSWIELSVDENAHRYLGLRAELAEFDGMLSESDVQGALSYSSSLKEIKEEGRWGLTCSDYRMIVSFIRNKPSPTKVRGVLRGRSVLTNVNPQLICHEESIRVFGRTQPIEKNLRVRFQDVPPGAPLVFIQDMARTLCLEVFAEEEVTLAWSAPEIRIDFGEFFSREQLVAIQRNPPKGFAAILDGATLILNLSAKTGRLYVCHGNPIFIPLGTVSFPKTNKVGGIISLKLFERQGKEIDCLVVPYELQKATLSLKGKEEVVRNERIYLNPAAITAFNIEIAMEDSADHSALTETPFSRPRIQIDFGNVLRLEDVTRLAQYPPSGFSASVIAATVSLVLTAQAESWTLSNKIPIHLPIRIQPFTPPESKPYGTILVKLLHESTLIAAEEFDVSLHQKELDTSATPPVIVAWDNGAPPQLKAGAASRCRFAIFNARCDRRGFSKPLVTNPWATSEAEDDPVTPRIRLSVPPTLHGGQPLSFQEKAALADVKITAHSKGSRHWNPRRLGIYQELWPDKVHPHVLEKNDHLLVTLENLTPRQAGTWSLTVTFVDFPGYSSATFLLPIHVSD